MIYLALKIILFGLKRLWKPILVTLTIGALLHVTGIYPAGDLIIDGLSLFFGLLAGLLDAVLDWLANEIASRLNPFTL